LIGGVVYALNAMPVFQAVNGLETGVSALMVALAGAATLAVAARSTARRALAWGVLCGLCFLSRTDTALIVIWLGLYVLAASTRRVRDVLVGGGAALAVIAPWLL